MVDDPQDTENKEKDDAARVVDESVKKDAGSPEAGNHQDDGAASRTENEEVTEDTDSEEKNREQGANQQSIIMMVIAAIVAAFEAMGQEVTAEDKKKIKEEVEKMSPEEREAAKEAAEEATQGKDGKEEGKETGQGDPNRKTAADGKEGDTVGEGDKTEGATSDGEKKEAGLQQTFTRLFGALGANTALIMGLVAVAMTAFNEVAAKQGEGAEKEGQERSEVQEQNVAEQTQQAEQNQQQDPETPDQEVAKEDGLEQTEDVQEVDTRRTDGQVVYDDVAMAPIVDFDPNSELGGEDVEASTDLQAELAHMEPTLSEGIGGFESGAAYMEGGNFAYASEEAHAADLSYNVPGDGLADGHVAEQGAELGNLA